MGDGEHGVDNEKREQAWLGYLAPKSIKMDNVDAFKQVFDSYTDTSFSINNNVFLWQCLLPEMIRLYKKENPNQKWIQDSGFSAYDTPFGRLHTFPKSSTMYVDDLDLHKEDLLQWVKVLSIVRHYNAVELGILYAIQIRFYPHFNSPILGRKEANKVITQIKDDLTQANIEFERGHNEYLIS